MAQRIPILESGASPSALHSHTGKITTVIVTPDGRHAISASEDQTMKVWDLSSGMELYTLKGHTKAVNAIAVTLDNGRVVSASDDATLRIWNLQNGMELFKIGGVFSDGHTRRVTAVLVTPDNQHAVSASDDKTLKVWDLQNGKHLCTFHGHNKEIEAMSVTHDGQRIISAAYDKDEWVRTYILKVWRLEHGGVTHTLKGLGPLGTYSRDVNAIDVTPDDRYVVSASNDRTLKVWDLEEKRRGFFQKASAFFLGSPPMHNLQGHSGIVWAAKVTPDGQRAVSASSDHTLKVWDLKRGTELRTLTGHSDSVNALAVTPDGQHAVSASADATLKVWNLESGEINVSFSADRALSACAVAPDGLSIVAGDTSGRVHILSLESFVLGSSVVTAWCSPIDASYAFGCPLCRTWSKISASTLGTGLPCPQCGRAIKLNEFFLSADWRPVSKAWRG